MTGCLGCLELAMLWRWSGSRLDGKMGTAQKHCPGGQRPGHGDADPACGLGEGFIFFSPVGSQVLEDGTTTH